MAKRILTIETTGHFASVALNNRQIMNDTDYSHLQEITPMIVQIMAEEDLKGEELDAVAVSRGPGSFTGIRIGMATAKGFAQIWNKPVICVPTLDGIKKRVRPGMGRCQGGFCSPTVTKIIAEYLGVPITEVRKSSADSPVVFESGKGEKR